MTKKKAVESHHSGNTVEHLKPQARIIPRPEHIISRENISDNALKVLYRLNSAGYKAYLVGGGVRDILLGITPKDFDVVTDAHPEQIRELFRNCSLIGRRFRLAHVRFGPDIIEVSTFRALHRPEDHDDDVSTISEEGRILRDNVYGDIDDDVWRRDFTINALFYNIADFSIVDYVGGMRDVEQRQLRLIGDPASRYREDPVRMLRAARFAAKLQFSISEETAQPIHELSDLLCDIPPARLYEEFLKLFLSGHAVASYESLQQYHLFEQLFAETARSIEGNNFAKKLLLQALKNTDLRIAEEKPVTPAFLVAAILYVPMSRIADEHLEHGLPEVEAVHLASDTVISRQVHQLAIPRKITIVSREIWALQSRFKHRQGRRAMRLLGHPRFRAAYDFLALRAQAGENLGEMVEWWTAFQEQHPEVLYKHTPKQYRPRRRRKNFRK